MRLYFINFWLRTQNPCINKLNFAGIIVSNNYMDAIKDMEKNIDFVGCEYEFIPQNIDVQFPEFNTSYPVIILVGE